MNKKTITRVSMFIGMLAFTVSANAQKSDNQRKPSPEKIIERLDTNKDGLIDMEEAKKAKKGRLVEYFDKIDKNSDGYLSSEELKLMLDKTSNKKSKE